MVKQKIGLAYAKFCFKYKRFPSRADLKTIGFSRDQVRGQFGNYENLRLFAKENWPDMLDGLLDPSLFEDKAHLDLVSRTKKFKRFVVTSAVAGAPAHKGFLNSLKNYCRVNKAMLLVIPANYALYDLDHDLVNDPEVSVLFKPLSLNQNIVIDPIKIDPKQVDPVVGLDIIGKKREGTIIVGSPKQRRVAIANSNEKMARMIQSTGAVTKPRYVPSDGIMKRRDRLADEQHVMGAVVVEIADKKLFHFRNIEMGTGGRFIDLFKRYSEQEVVNVGCEAVVQGDYHVLSTDPVVDAAVDEMCKLGRPKYRVLHDFFDGQSINHHNLHNKIERAILAKQNLIDLRSELQANKNALEAMRKKKTAEQIVLVKSNHYEFLYRYLNKGDFTEQNYEIATELMLIAMRGLDPLKDGLEQLFGLKKGKDLVWLKRDQDFRVCGVELGSHGDLGANGKRNPGSKGMFKAYGKSVYGHCHHSEIWHQAMSVGTSTYMRLGYNKGASSWDHTQCIVYKDGTRQLVSVINGEWRLAK